MRLNPGVAKRDFVALILLKFVLDVVLFFGNTWMPQLLHNKPFNYPEKQAGSLAGRLNFYDDLVLMVFELAVGFLMDVFGRRGFTLLGMVLMSAMCFVTPFATTVYPGVLLCTIFIKIGTLVGLNTPLTVDYIAKDSMGYIAACFSIVAVPA